MLKLTEEKILFNNLDLIEFKTAKSELINLISSATGELRNFGSIDEYSGAHDLSDLKTFIEAHGGFLRNTVSSKTDYLICNDLSSKTKKIEKATELEIPVISEKEFLEMVEAKNGFGDN